MSETPGFPGGANIKPVKSETPGVDVVDRQAPGATSPGSGAPKAGENRPQTETTGDAEQIAGLQRALRAEPSADATDDDQTAVISADTTSSSDHSSPEPRRRGWRDALAKKFSWFFHPADDESTRDSSGMGEEPFAEPGTTSSPASDRPPLDKTSVMPVITDVPDPLTTDAGDAGMVEDDEDMDGRTRVQHVIEPVVAAEYDPARTSLIPQTPGATYESSGDGVEITQKGRLKDRVKKRKDIDKGKEQTRKDAFRSLPSDPDRSIPGPGYRDMDPTITTAVFPAWEDIAATGREPTVDEYILAARQALALEYNAGDLHRTIDEFNARPLSNEANVLQIRSAYRWVRGQLENQLTNQLTHRDRDSALVDDETQTIIDNLRKLEEGDGIDGLSLDQIKERGPLVEQALTAIADQWWEQAGPWIDNGFPGYVKRTLRDRLPDRDKIDALRVAAGVVAGDLADRGGRLLTRAVDAGAKVAGAAAARIEERRERNAAATLLPATPDGTPTPPPPQAFNAPNPDQYGFYTEGTASEPSADQSSELPAQPSAEAPSPDKNSQPGRERYQIITGVPDVDTGNPDADFEEISALFLSGRLG